VVDFRIYRAGYLPALVAVVALLFALQSPPGPLPEVAAPAAFDQTAAATTAREILATAPDRPPGSSGDSAIADMVEGQFRHVSEGQVAEQRFSGSLDGDQVDLRNVILTLPGQTTRTVVVMAPRDSAAGPGAASSAAATATLLELVNEVRLSRHTKTLVFVSTDAGSDGALGAKEFADNYPLRDQVDGVVVISQPGSATPMQPSLVDSSDGPQSASAQLASTARVALTDQTSRAPGGEGIFGELARLALPSGLGEQAPLIETGVAAVALSSAGERPLPVSQDQPEDLSPDTLGGIGRAALQLVGTMDGAAAPPEHGPDAYLNLAGNLVPGWTLSLLALTLLLPSALACVDGLARAMRSGERVGWALAWSLSRALPLIGALILLYLMAAVGIVARPDFPFDPNSFDVGPGQAVAMTFLGAVALAGYYAIRGWRGPGAMPTTAAAPALGAAALLGGLIAWFANPYLGLLAVPVAHVWLLGARRAGPLPWPLVALGAALSLLPLAAAFAHLAGRLDFGANAPWLLLLMVDDGQIGFWTTLALCLLIGGLVGIVALSLRPKTPSRPAPSARLRVGSPPSGEPVGSVLDASPIASRDAPDDLQRGRQPSA
jgi:Peptidase family M28